MKFGHALMARRFGVRTPDITLLPIGGMARLERIPEDPGQEIAVALAGPAVNVAIWAVLSLFLGVSADITALVAIDDTGQGFLERLAAINLFLVLFNMIPAFPMDGGRVLRALLATRMDRVRATRIAAYAGQGIAFLFGFLGLTTGNPLLMLIAVFVFLAAMAESSDVALHDLAKGYLARDAIITSYEPIGPDDPMQSAEAALLRTTQAEFPVLDTDRQLVGVLTKAAIVANAQDRDAKKRVSDAMTIEIATVPLFRTARGCAGPAAAGGDGLCGGHRPQRPFRRLHHAREYRRVDGAQPGPARDLALALRHERGEIGGRNGRGPPETARARRRHRADNVPAS